MVRSDIDMSRAAGSADARRSGGLSRWNDRWEGLHWHWWRYLWAYAGARSRHPRMSMGARLIWINLEQNADQVAQNAVLAVRCVDLETKVN
jgi:hypothetical protein